jgi:uncharacterized protein YhbP (UPF0306 family)
VPDYACAASEASWCGFSFFLYDEQVNGVRLYLLSDVYAESTRMKNVQALREDPSLAKTINEKEHHGEDSDIVKGTPTDEDSAEAGAGAGLKKTVYKRHEAFKEFVSVEKKTFSVMHRLLTKVSTPLDCVLFRVASRQDFAWDNSLMVLP